jgi:hypothetical protein
MTDHAEPTTDAEPAEAPEEKPRRTQRRSDRTPSRAYVDLPVFGGTMWTHPDDR